MSDEPEEPRFMLARQLRASQAHAGLERALAGFPVALAGRRLDGHPHTAWELVEHLRLAAEDLVSYCRDADYREMEFPAGYWPATAAPPSEEAWRRSLDGLRAAVEAMASHVEDPAVDLYAQVPAAQRAHHHVYRAALILLDHDAYHVGQLVSLRHALGSWPPS